MDAVFGSGSLTVNFVNFVRRSGFMIKIWTHWWSGLTTPMCHGALVPLVLLRPLLVANNSFEIILAQGIMFNSSERVCNTNFWKFLLNFLIILIMLHSSDSYIFNILQNKGRLQWVAHNIGQCHTDLIKFLLFRFS